jgi:hypothetical protein
MLLVRCSVCGETKERSEFACQIRNGARTGMPNGRCKPCSAAYKRAKNRERPFHTLSRRSLTKMGMETPLRVLQQVELDAAKEARLAWREWIMRRAPDDWVVRHYNASGKPWNNPRLSAAEQYKLRYRLDMAFRCGQRVRLRAKKKLRRDDVAMAIRDAAKGKQRAVPLLASLGYTPGQLRTHIERQFKGRMSWQAFSQGKIHIDHIRPLSSFDLSDEDQFRDAFGLHNMRPMWARDNIAKGACVEHLV